MKTKNPLVAPVLKWVGGKRQLLHEILPLIEELMPRGATYVEPFLGGGAVLFALQPAKAIVCDLNSELINVYIVVRDEPDELLERLEEHARLHCEEYFYRVRAMDRAANFSLLPNVERAARLIYLNRTCYNGLYRVNAAGYFNVPFGRYKLPMIVNEETLRAASAYLRNNDVTIGNEDYLDVLGRLDGNCFVYIDPPYMPLTASSSFTKYTGGGFDFDRQRELRDACRQLRARNIPFVESNSDCEAIRELYSDFEIGTVRATRAINSVGSRRGEINEVLIYYRRRGGD